MTIGFTSQTEALKAARDRLELSLTVVLTDDTTREMITRIDATPKDRRSESGHADLVKAVKFVLRGIKSGNIPNRSILPPISSGQASVDIIPLSEILNNALRKAGAL